MKDQDQAKSPAGSCDVRTDATRSSQEPQGATVSGGVPLGAYVSPWAALQRVHARELARIELVFGHLPAGGAR
jgi:hypothetical protein